jgi:hypothetical protein
MGSLPDHAPGEGVGKQLVDALLVAGDELMDMGTRGRVVRGNAEVVLVEAHPGLVAANQALVGVEDRGAHRDPVEEQL